MPAIYPKYKANINLTLWEQIFGLPDLVFLWKNCPLLDGGCHVILTHLHWCSNVWNCHSLDKIKNRKIREKVFHKIQKFSTHIICLDLTYCKSVGYDQKIKCLICGQLELVICTALEINSIYTTHSFRKFQKNLSFNVRY